MPNASSPPPRKRETVRLFWLIHQTARPAGPIDIDTDFAAWATKHGYMFAFEDNDNETGRHYFHMAKYYGTYGFSAGDRMLTCYANLADIYAAFIHETT